MFPESYVLAFDRSGSSGTGAVAVVGNFKTYDTISVFRTELPSSKLSGGRLAGGGPAYEELCLGPFINEGGTMRFKLLSSELRDPPGVYDFEFQLETCRGTVQEGAGGRILCLGPAGQDLVTLRRHQYGRSFLIGKNAYQIMASAPEDRWPEIEPTLRAIVDSFRISSPL